MPGGGIPSKVISLVRRNPLLEGAENAALRDKQL